MIQHDHFGNGRVLIAEGLETAVSIKETATLGRIMASFGIYNMKNYEGAEKI